jgi:hypothetical protein
MILRRQALPLKIQRAFRGRDWIGTNELAKAIGLSPAMVRHLCRKGVLPSRSFNPKLIKPRRIFTLSDVQQYWETTFRQWED